MKKDVIWKTVFAAVLIVFAVWLVVHQLRSRPVRDQSPVRCESCGYEYVPKRLEANPVCPQCGARAGIRLLKMRCKSCGNVFTAFELDPKQFLVREPGGEWMSIQECDFKSACPECGSNDTEGL